MDYRALNRITMENRYSVPRIDDLSDQPGPVCILLYPNRFAAYLQPTYSLLP